jgi:predicted kinase
LAAEGSPTLVVVSGPPGSGKTTLAHELSKGIGCPAICRDEIKEGMAQAHGREFQGAPGDPLTQRTFPLFFEVLRVLLEGRATVVAEAAFQDRLWREGLAPFEGLAHLRIVHCKVDPEVAAERAARRVAVEEKRRAHGDSLARLGVDEWKQAYQAFERVSLPAPAIEVDTTSGYEPELSEVITFVSAHSK